MSSTLGASNAPLLQGAVDLDSSLEVNALPETRTPPAIVRHLWWCVPSMGISVQSRSLTWEGRVDPSAVARAAVHASAPALWRQGPARPIL